MYEVFVVVFSLTLNIYHARQNHKKSFCIQAFWPSHVLYVLVKLDSARLTKCTKRQIKERNKLFLLRSKRR